MNHLSFPEGYKLHKEINIQKDKKLALMLNIASLIISILMIILGAYIMPMEVIISGSLFLYLIILFLSIIMYIVFHEVIHGFFIKYYCGEKAEYGFTGLYAYAGKKNAYFDKPSYRVIALSPVVIWGVLLLILNLIFKENYFWMIYFVQVMNISGAVGDYYVMYLTFKLPEDIIVNDDGVSMRFYVKAPIK